MKCHDKIYSKEDKTIKYVFRLDNGMIVEAAFIDNNTNKNIICVGSHTGCNLRCKFCFTTDCADQIQSIIVSDDEIVEQVKFIVNDLNLKDRLLLVSYMGCGEPLLNVINVVNSMEKIRAMFQPSRFGLATLMPNAKTFSYLLDKTQQLNLNLKIHLSLHFTDDIIRAKWMPAATPIKPAVDALENYHKVTGQSVEVHFALIEDLNDSTHDAEQLCCLLKNKDIPVKLLQYNERKSIGNKKK